MSSSDVSSRDIDAEIAALRETLMELDRLYWNLVSQLQAKQNELVSIEYKLQSLGWPGVTAAAYLGSFIGEMLGDWGSRRQREMIDALLRRRSVLMEEIEKERQELTQLARTRTDLSRRLTFLVTQRRGIIPAELARPPPPVREWEIEELYRIVNDPFMPASIRERARKRLRDLGYQV